MDHSSHRLSAYKDTDHKNVVFCSVCSREDPYLSEPCPGKYVPISQTTQAKNQSELFQQKNEKDA